jgi:hypothetical protein
MTSDPGDLVLDPTCGSGTTAYVAEQYGRRWITCDTSRVAVTLAKQRLMTATYDYYYLAHPDEGVACGFRYKTVPHVTLGGLANKEPMVEEQLHDQPIVDRSKVRVSGPFTVEACLHLWCAPSKISPRSRRTTRPSRAVARPYARPNGAHTSCTPESVVAQEQESSSRASSPKGARGT